MDRKTFLKGSAILSASVIVNPFSFSSCGLITRSKESRNVLRVLNSSREMVGTLPIIRAFAGDQNDFVSPYVLLDEFGPVKINPGDEPLGVEAHPHAGVTPTTYFMEGTGHHKDSLNYDIQVGKGEFMMFSSGRGAIHMEETGKYLFDHGGLYHGFQIWLNNPSTHKFVQPETFIHQEDKIPQVVLGESSIKVVIGEFMGAKSPARTYSPAFYYDIEMRKDARLTIPVDAQHNAFIYSLNGLLELKNQTELKKHQLALFERGKEEIDVYAKEQSRLLLLGGLPLNEPVYSYGPFVMNTEEEIRLCLKNYREGKMGDPDLDW